MNLRVLLVCLALVSGWAVAEEQEKALVMFIGDQEIGLLLVVDTGNGNLISADEIPEGALDEEALISLERYMDYACAPCVKIEDFAHFTEDHQRGVGTISVRPAYLPVQSVEYRKARRDGDVVLQNKAGLSGNFVLSVRDDSALKREVYSASLGLDMSLGPLGVLRSGLRSLSDEEGEWRDTRLPAYLERHWVDAQATMNLGETSIEIGRNASGVGVLGFRVFRNFSTRPDLLSTPAFDFFTTLERPSTVELYIDSEKKRTEEFSSPGRVNISDYRPSTSGKISLIVKDALGATRVFEQDFYENGQLLGIGIWDFSFAAGQVRQGEEVVDEEYAAGGYLRRGITNQLTLGISAGALHRQDKRKDYVAGLSAIIGTGMGTIELESRFRDFEIEGEGESHAINWRVGKSLSKNIRVGMGLTGFYEENFGGFYGTGREIRGGRAYGNIGYKSLYMGMAHSDLGETRSDNFSVGYRWGNGISVSGGYQRSEDIAEDESDELWSLNLSYNFGAKNSGISRVSARSTKINSRDDVSSQVQMSGTAMDTALNWSTRIFHDETFGVENDRGEFNMNYRSDKASFSYRGYREDLVEDTYEHNMDVTTGFAIGPRFKAIITGTQSSTSGYAVIDTEQPGVRVKASGRDVISDWRGLAIVPVSGFQRSFVDIDFNSLPNGSLVKKNLLETSVMPKQFAYVQFELKAPGAFLIIPGAVSGQRVNVNGEEATYYSSGMFVENLVVGKNTIEHRGKRYSLEITEVDNSFPTYEVK